MNKTILLLSFLFSFAAQASANNLIKTCDTTMEILSEVRLPVQIRIEIRSAGNGLVAKVTQTSDDQTQTQEQPVIVTENTVRAGLTGEPDAMDLNLAEKIVAHAMMVTEDPVLSETVSAGLDLKSVRSAKVYQIGEFTNMGGMVVLEAYDQDQKNLGSFMGGFLVSPCK